MPKLLKNIEGSGPLGRFLLNLQVRFWIQTQPMHPSLDAAGSASRCDGTQLLPCSALYGLTLVQRDPAHSPARCTSRESWNENHVPLPDGQELSLPPLLVSKMSLVPYLIVGLDRVVKGRPIHYVTPAIPSVSQQLEEITGRDAFVWPSFVPLARSRLLLPGLLLTISSI